MFKNERIDSLRGLSPEAAPDEAPKDSASLSEFHSVWPRHSDLTGRSESRDDEQRSGYLTPLGGGQMTLSQRSPKTMWKHRYLHYN